ncbi:hypothetical protein MPSI1_003615 [Malassezia psittaci]|uniref:Mitochondrial carrier n=1 Tax=Malassezia psittaci TaxID=1821823 RepID=A0AAF0JMA2_9BASI|nr:hypothetical protein MPSI1_003615 [Malassezia psittaci]
MLIADLFVLVVGIVVYGLGCAIALALTMPFFVSLTRLRANYLPKAVSLTNVLSEGEASTAQDQSVLYSLMMRTRRATAKIGPVVDGVIPMIKRTKRLEGWRGLYQGTTIVASGVFFTYTISVILFLGFARSFDSIPLEHREPFIWEILSDVMQAVVVLPFDVVLKRTMVHPQRLNWFQPKTSMQQVLSLTEYAQPWRLFQIPGLLYAMLLRVTLVSTLSLGAQRCLLPYYEPLQPSDPSQDDFEGPTSASTKATVAGFTAYLIVTLLLQLVAVPLECIVVRLSIQRPITQQPLHIAYANNASPYRPTADSHQASASTQESVSSTKGKKAARDIDLREDRADSDADPVPHQAAEPELDQDEQHSTKPTAGQSSATSKSEQHKETFARSSEESDENATLTLHRDSSDIDEEQALPMINETVPHVQPSAPRTLSPMSEPVIALRPCDESLDEMDSFYGAAAVEPYMGAKDCLHKMIAEEGYESLYRGLPFSMGMSLIVTLGLLPGLIDMFSLFS